MHLENQPVATEPVDAPQEGHQPEVNHLQVMATLPIEEREAYWYKNVYRGDVKQLTLRAIITGMFLGGIMSVSNLYVGLMTGWGFGVTITSGILAFAIFKALERVLPGGHFTDLENNTLPSVSWIVGQQLEHPPASTCKGENQTVSYVNAIMNSPAWSSTAIFVVWDEWGGFYDHVAPPQLDGISYRRAGPHRDRQAAEVQAPGAVLGGSRAPGQLTRDRLLTSHAWSTRLRTAVAWSNATAT